MNQPNETPTLDGTFPRKGLGNPEHLDSFPNEMLEAIRKRYAEVYLAQRHTAFIIAVLLVVLGGVHVIYRYQLIQFCLVIIAESRNGLSCE